MTEHTDTGDVSNAAAGDGWDDEDWGSLEEPNSSNVGSYLFNIHSMLPDTVFSKVIYTLKY